MNARHPMPGSTFADDGRLVPLTGGHNFRDLGGYEAADGWRVRWQLLYRSGKLSALTADDVAQLAPKGIRIVCDLRTPAERAREPSVPGFSRAHRGWDYDVGHRSLLAAATAPGATPEHVRDALAATYEAMPWIFAEIYAQAFQHIIAGDLPMVFHCTAGKDRTGILAALILLVLGVPEEQVIKDYLLTDRFLDTDALAAAPRSKSGGAGAAGFSFVRALSAELRAPLLTCDPAYLHGALRAIEARHGSVLGYFDEALGVGAEGVAALRQRLLEPGLTK